MKIGALVCLAVLLTIMQPAIAVQTMNKSGLPQAVVDLGEIGKQKFNITHNGTISPGDLCWFKFNVVAQKNFFISVLNPDQRYSPSYYISNEPTMNFGFVVYDKDLNYVTSGESIVLVDLKPGSYFVRLDARPYEKTNYTIMVNDAAEMEPNDGLSEASDIGTISKRLICGGSLDPAGDVDFLKFNVPGNQSGVLKIYASKDMTLTLYGYNESKKRYLPESSGEGDLTGLVKPGLNYFRVVDYGRQTDTYNYTLDMDLKLIACEEDTNNNFTSSAFMGILNESNESTELVANGCISNPDDFDYYNFKLPQNMSVSIGTNTSDETVMCLYDSDKNKKECSMDYSSIERKLTAGNYYVVVRPYNSEAVGTSYELYVDRQKK
jgi:hypothetical protein